MYKEEKMLKIDPSLNDEMDLYRLISERELTSLIGNNAIFRFTKTSLQSQQGEAFAIRHQIKKAENEIYSNMDNESEVYTERNKIVAYIESNTKKLQKRLREINQNFIFTNNKSCAGQKLFSEICKNQKFLFADEILAKWDQKSPNLVTDIDYLIDILNDLEFSCAVMHEEDLQDLEINVGHSTALCCLTIGKANELTQEQWAEKKNKVAVIKFKAKDIKKFLVHNQVNNTKMCFCRVKYNDTPDYMYDQDVPNFPIEIFIREAVNEFGQAQLVQDYLDALAYKTKNFEFENEARIILINLNLQAFDEDNIFIKQSKTDKLSYNIYVNPYLDEERKNEINKHIKQFNEKTGA